MTVDWQTIADATAQGAIYALMAVGIGLVFGVLRLVNFAYGQIVMAGAYALVVFTSCASAADRVATGPAISRPPATSTGTGSAPSSR